MKNKIMIDEDIDDTITVNNIPEAVGMFDCPFCNTQHSGNEKELIAMGPQISRYETDGFDFKEILKCPITHKLYWYLNGV